MAVQLKAGSLADFGGSMAEAIENEMALLIGPLPDSPAEITNRRVLFVAIARGVVRHLRDREQAFEVTASVIANTVNTTVDITAQDV
jgi:hypothetical protein